MILTAHENGLHEVSVGLVLKLTQCNNFFLVNVLCDVNEFGSRSVRRNEKEKENIKTAISLIFKMYVLLVPLSSVDVSCLNSF